MSGVKDRGYVYQDVPQEIRRLGGVVDDSQLERIWEHLWAGLSVSAAALIELSRAPYEIEPLLSLPIGGIASSSFRAVGEVGVSSVLEGSGGNTYTARLRLALRGYGA